MSLFARKSIAALLTVGAVVWILINGPVEGPVLVVLSYNHGITVADLLSVAAVMVAGWLLLSAPPQAPRPQPVARMGSVADSRFRER